ncbi:MAG: NYN domain-containing protein [Thermoflexus sp.]|jgi:predicted RNA-binding protein with PIN domain|uniref:NYN domain-containing protein n=1 Tax=Thermoflexus TaxID=1495649 RepID=UPI001C75885F|nr:MULTISPECIES: NYN domain-containing protein [Thermoflexus]MDT7884826.1 NYN domain-containing protein [Thermoflexus sp.]MDT7948721.1 NYN domain-containing protein [Thermoflexus sp.]QWK11268.1 MAG: NYN domain-containing protein [Thermoflexus hugenholtzii]
MPFLIDGHNLIGALPDLDLDDPDDEARLVERLQRLAWRTGRRITVVFDRGAPGGMATSFSRGGVTVRFAPAGVSADELMIRQIRAERNPRGLIVVSSDRAVQEAARRQGASAWSAAQFRAYMERELGEGKRATEEAEEKPGVNEAELEQWLRLFQGKGGVRE